MPSQRSVNQILKTSNYDKQKIKKGSLISELPLIYFHTLKDESCNWLCLIVLINRMDK